MVQMTKNARVLMEIEADVERAMNEEGDEVVKHARANASWSSSIPQNIRADKAKTIHRDIVVPVGVRKDGFKWAFFEDGTTSRRTRKGYNRGVGPRRPIFKPAVEAAIRSGLNLKSS